MKLLEYYDVICAGSGLSSYLCAALLANRGKQVIVIDDSDQAPLCIDDHNTVVEPHFSVFSGLADTAALGQSLKELNLDSAQFKRLETITQILSPGHRVGFSHLAEETRQEFDREFGERFRAVSDFFSMLYATGQKIPGFIESPSTPMQSKVEDVAKWKQLWGPYYGALNRYRPIALHKILDPNVSAVCEMLGGAMLGSASNIAPINLSCEQLLRGLALLFQGQYYYSGGLQSLKKKLEGIIRAAGGIVKYKTQVESLVTEDGKITGVLLPSFEGIIRSKAVVLSSALKRLYSTLPVAMHDSSTKRNVSRAVPHSWRFTFSITVKADVLPIGASPHMIYVGSYGEPLQEENYLAIQVLSNDMYPGMPSSESATLLVTALVPYRASSMDYEYLRRLGGRMLRELSGLIPFLEENIVRVYPDFRKNTDALEAAYPFRGVDWLAENLVQYYVKGARSVQDFWGVAWSTPHKNLYFSGRTIWPALGIYGEALSARKIFDDLMFPSS